MRGFIANTTGEVYLDSLPAETTLLTLASKPLGTCAPFSCLQVPGTYSSSHTSKITQSMILKTGRLAQ